MSFDLDDVAPLPLTPFQRVVSGTKGPHPATIASKRQRQRDLDAMGKKSRKTRARSKFQQHQTEQDVRGMARVYLLGQGTPAMQVNVRKAVERMAADAPQGLPAIEDKFREILVAYGDMD